MEKEWGIRDPDNKRIQKMVKVDITKEIQEECKRNFELILFRQAEQVSQLFFMIDEKHTYGIISELANAVLGIEEYEAFENQADKKRFASQYHRCLDNINKGLTNLSTQLIFALKNIPQNVLDQNFIKNTIETVLQLQLNFINLKQNNILPSQKEFLNGLIKELVELYNSQIEQAIRECDDNNTFWRKTNIFIDSMNNGCSYLQACANVLVYSNSQEQFRKHLLNNRIDIKFIEEQTKEDNNV